MLVQQECAGVEIGVDRCKIREVLDRERQKRDSKSVCD
jgi:hypothetical protein